MSNYNTILQSNNTDLQTILNTINELPQAGSADAVLYTEQNLTEEQQSQARENIGAAPEDIIPNHTAADNNKFLRVVNGAVVWSAVPSAEAEVF